ncbi:MAG TPA: FtsX-like permease family protein, partial [Longimicrobiales bacterium]|nr:FtsX-like permease family protein [Longimicrobiales bacterium]
RLRDVIRRSVPLAHDARFAVRSLLRRPAYLVAGTLTLGIGTGGVAIVYAAADWVLLRDVPGVGEPGELVLLSLESRDDSWGDNSWGVMQPDIERMRERMPSLSGLEVATTVQVHVTVPGGPPPSRETSAMVSPGYFRLLGMAPAVGRFFHPGDHANGSGPPEVVVGHELWRRYWSGDPGAVGREIEVNGRPYTVIGVAPRGFRGSELPGASRLWFAASAFPDLRPADAGTGIDRTGQLWERLVGRRVPGATVERVEAEANAVVVDTRVELDGRPHSFLPGHFVFRVYDGIGLDPEVRPRVRRTLGIVGVASLVLLVLATANVANLGLTRVASRRGVSAIRRALGAGSWRVAREPLLEGVVVGTLGGLAGLVLVLLGERAFAEAQLSSRGASLEGMSVGPAVVAVALAASLAAGVLSGLLPALVVRRERVLDWLGGDRRDGRSATRTRSLLVVAQVALSGTLLVAAGLFARTIVNLNAIELGFPRDAYVFSVDPGLDGRDDASVRGTLAGIQATARERFGTPAAGIVFPSPLVGYRITASLEVPEREAPARGSQLWTTGNGFFRAMGLRWVAGEGFEQELTRTDEALRPVVVNESMAAEAFPGVAPEAVVGRRVVLRGEERESVVVGVLADARLVSPLSDPGPFVFRPYDTDWSAGRAVFVVRTGLAAGRTRSLVSATVGSVDPGLPVYGGGTVGGLVDLRLADQRVVARLAGGLGLIGLILVALGLHGVLTYTVRDRTRELGIRSALGASRRELRGAVLRRGLRLTVLGLAAGIPLAWWLTRYVEARLFGVEALDPLTWASGVAVMIAVALASSWVPALRATRIAPVEALRER